MRKTNLPKLIQRKLDGELGLSEGKHLEDILAQSSEARALHDELILLNEALQEIPSLDPPHELKTEIMSRISARSSVAPALSPSLLRRFMAFFEELRPRFSYGLALGCLFGFVLCLSLITHWELGDIGLRENVVGSMVPSGRTAAPLISTEHLEGRGVSCAVDIARSDSTIGLQIRISSPEPVEVLLAYDADCLKSATTTRVDAATSVLSSRPGSLRLQHTGEQALMIALQRVKADRSDALLELRTDTEVIWKVLTF